MKPNTIRTLALLGAFLSSGCGVESEELPPGTGTFATETRVSDPTGTAWTIVGETFVIRDDLGEIVTTFEEQPGSPMKVLLLPEGAYTVEMTGDWYLQAGNGSNAIADRDWQLEDPSPIAFTVSRTRTARAIFTFVRNNGATIGYELGPRQLLAAITLTEGSNSLLPPYSGLSSVRLLITPSEVTCSEDAYGRFTTSLSFDATPVQFSVDPESPEPFLGLFTTAYNGAVDMTVSDNEGEQYVEIIVNFDATAYSTANIFILEGPLDVALPLGLDGCPLVNSFDVAAGTMEIHIGYGIIGFGGGLATFAFR